MRSRSYDCLILRLRKPRSLTAFRAPMPSVAIATQSTNSLTGTSPTAIIGQQDCGGPIPNAPGIAAPCPDTINLRLGAVRRLAYEAADCGLLSADLAAGIRRVKGVKKLGVKLAIG